VAKPELGTKRICAGCGTKFYDLNKSPITCPRCQAEFVIQAKPAPAAKKAAPAEEKEAAAGPEFVSLEDADNEKKVAARAVPGDDDDDFEADDAPLDDDEDDPFLGDEDEEDDDDVSGLIGSGRDSDDEDA